MVALIAAMTAPSALHRRLRQGRELARRSGRPVLVSVSAGLPLFDPLDAFAAASTIDAERVYWERPARGMALAGIGVAHRIAGDTASATAAWRDLLGCALTDDGDSFSGPLLVGGMAFDPQAQHTPLWAGFPDAQLTVPRLTAATRGGASTLTLNAVVGPGDDAEALEDRLLAYCDAILSARGPVLSGTACHGVHDTSPWDRRLPASNAGRAGSAARDGDPRGSALRNDRPIINGEYLELPSREAWEARVEAAARACANGYVEKVVLARALRVAATQPFDPALVLARLRGAYPSAYVFAVAHGARCFLGATPERLVRLRDGTVDVACLAGSAPRGGSTEEDAYLGRALLASAKDRAEHDVVVREVKGRLARVASDLRIPVAPRLLQLHNVQHLYTPVEARVRPGVGVLDLVQRLHPTPAVGGYPRAAALEYIRAHEGLDRGWYAGPIGWVDRRGEGEFAVALRSALLDGAAATLFAGCGIVAASRPIDEYAETCLKLRPMLAALHGDEDMA